MGDWLYLIIGIAVVAIGLLAGLLASGRRRKAVPAPTHGTDVISPPSEATDVPVADDLLVEEPTAPAVEKPEAAASRLVRLRQRLAGAQGGFGRGLLALLSRDRLDEDTWEAIEDTLLTADIGVTPTQGLVERLRTRLRVEGGHQPDARAVLREELIEL
ncbi:MAG TPA: signal recognition particle receptor subunit alpha, partial [Nocardioides sp.]|nr:signal recognition particle receptor subunit alpha [Nocardioides sp.]